MQELWAYVQAHGAGVLDTAEKLSKILAVVIGGIWAYVNYFRGRTYRPRLEPTLSGKLVDQEGKRFVLPSVTLKNVGLSKIQLQQRGSGVRVSYSETGATPEGGQMVWKILKVYSILESHRWIEPGETIRDDHLMVAVPPDRLAYRLELRLIAKGKEWNTETILVAPEPQPPQAAASLPVAAAQPPRRRLDALLSWIGAVLAGTLTGWGKRG